MAAEVKSKKRKAKDGHGTKKQPRWRTLEEAAETAQEATLKQTLFRAREKFAGASTKALSVSTLLATSLEELKELRPQAQAALTGAALDANKLKKLVERPPPIDPAAKEAARVQEEKKQLEIARVEAQQLMQEKYQTALETAQASLLKEPDPPGADETLAALARLAEGSAGTVAMAAAFCSKPQADDKALFSMLEAAQRGAQRASWAALATTSYGESKDFDKEWNNRMKQTAVQASEVAEKYARNCAESVQAAGKSQIINRSFCRFHIENRCLKGMTCEFSHNLSVLAPVPKVEKTEVTCSFFLKGECVRGAACPYAHGDEELDEVMKLKLAAQTGAPLAT